MDKIPTIFERDWESSKKKVVNQTSTPDPLRDEDGMAILPLATEKIDGTNVRITVRSGEIVRVEKRRNPTKDQKNRGIKDPWYVEASESSPEDKYIFDAIAWAEQNMNMLCLPDGEWSAEAFGEKIQGNPLNIEGHRLFIFSYHPLLAEAALPTAPTDYEGLKEFLPEQTSVVKPGQPIEGIVWWHKGHPIGKIKTKDF